MTMCTKIHNFKISPDTVRPSFFWAHYAPGACNDLSPASVLV